MTCSDTDLLLNARLDGELDAAGSLAVERHLAGCEECSLLCRRLEQLRSEIRAADLRYDSSQRLRVAARPRWKNLWRSPWVPAAAVAAVVLTIGVSMVSRRDAGYADREVVDSHVRSLISGHLIDVPSSDRHTVKPWFQGRLDFSPPVADLEVNGFPLAGGRVDVLAGRPVAALVYRRRAHVINLWIVPVGRAGGRSGPGELDGYHLLRWTGGAFAYCAVSDVSPGELRAFAELVRAQPAP